MIHLLKFIFYVCVFHTARNTSHLTICQDFTFFHSPQHTEARHKVVMARDNIHIPLNLKLRPVRLFLCYSHQPEIFSTFHSSHFPKRTHKRRA